jgi:hypothetical protein
MRILIDSLSSQVQVQFQGSLTTEQYYPIPHRRLNTLLGAMVSGGASLYPAPGTEWEICYSCGPIDATQLQGVDVFFVMTHCPASDTTDPAWQWSSAELSAIRAFVEGGGGLLLLTNHPSYMQYDAALAATFGVTLQNIFISGPGGWLTLSGDLLNQADFGPSFLFGVDSLAAHDGCPISASDPPVAGCPFTWLAAYPPDANAPADSYFAAQVTYGQGQVIVVANSGIVGDYGGTPAPACGGVASGSNLMFVLNCLRILGGQQQATMPGYCPGGQG